MKYPILVILAAICIVSCKGKKAVDFNNSITATESAFRKAAQSSQPVFDTLFSNDAYGAIDTLAIQMEKKADSAITELNSLESGNLTRAEEFKKAAIGYLTFSKNIYSNYRGIAEAGTAEGRQEKRHALRSLLKQGIDASNNLRIAQVNFANANGFLIK